MNKIICEIIPCKNFNERLKLTKEFLKLGITPLVILENCLFIDYSIRSRRFYDKSRQLCGAN